ncbi:hypothetical protein ABZ318_36820 [Streptomyces sp. NPDC006197]|uniref:hypothetical protein n=1 Tax=Streptomyces sp. NPDC006197 TaxID=3156685 RepID=UPI0033BC3A41
MAAAGPSASTGRPEKDVQAAIKFLNWLDEREQQLVFLDQAGFDVWLISHPTQHVVIESFTRWATVRRLTGPLEPPRRGRPFAVNFQTAVEYDQQLRRCFNDSALPREIRIIGALVRFYVLPVAKIIEVTTDRSRRDETGSYLAIDRRPVPLSLRTAPTQTGPVRQGPVRSATHHRLHAPGS